MNSHHKLILKKGKEKPVKNYHHWIFSGAVASLSESAEDGSLVSVYSSDHERLGTAYINRASSIIARMVDFSDADPLIAIEESIDNALTLRQSLFHDKETTAYRLINAEGDRLPGLIVDKYGDYLVIQVATLGIEKLKPLILEMLQKKVRPKGIYEKSSLPARREEGLTEYEGLLTGDLAEHVLVKENGISYVVDIVGGQKTGFFLDQREMRQLVREYAKDKNVLNCFSYTGGFSLAALAGNAARVTSVDVSLPAIERAEENAVLNTMQDRHRGIVADVFMFLREQQQKEYDFIILDPPAFVKRKTDIIAGCRGYKDVNRIAFSLLKEKSLLLTSSCSHFVDEKLFQQVVFQAAREANRQARIISKHRMAPDHPINMYHPEGEYLKSLFVYVE